MKPMNFKITKTTTSVETTSFNASFASWKSYYDSPYYKNWGESSTHPHQSVTYDVNFDISELEDLQIIKGATPATPVTIKIKEGVLFIVEGSWWHGLVSDIIYKGYYLISHENDTDPEKINTSTSQHYLLTTGAIKEEQPTNTNSHISAEIDALEREVLAIEKILFWRNSTPASLLSEALKNELQALQNRRDDLLAEISRLSHIKE